MITMKKTNLRIISAILSVLFVLTAFPLSAFAVDSYIDGHYENDGTYVVRLNVTGGDFATVFNQATDLMRESATAKIEKLRIEVPAGTYDVKNELRLYENTSVIFNGVTLRHVNGDTTLLRLGRKSADWDNYNNGKGRPGYSGFSNIYIEGGSFNGCGYSAALMRFGHSKNITIKNASFSNVKNAHMLEFGACDGVTLDNCRFMDFKGDWGSATNYEAVQFDALAGNHFSAYNPINDETPCKNVTVKNCYFKNLERGLGTHTGIVNSYFTNMTYQNNTFENITGYAIIATNYKDSLISGNTIKNCGAGIYFRTMESGHNQFYASKTHSNSHSKLVGMNTKIVWNTINVTSGYATTFRNVSYGIQLYGEKLNKAAGYVTAGDFRCSGVTVMNNTVNLYTTGYAIWLNGTTYTNVRNNTVNCNIVKKGKGGTGDGVRLQLSVSNTISGNKINNWTKKGYDGSMCGIVLISSSTYNTITYNTISKTKKDGIQLTKSASCNASYNTISNAKRNGIAVYNSKKTTIIGNKISNCKRYGVFANKKKLVKKFSKNKIKKCKTKKKI